MNTDRAFSKLQDNEYTQPEVTPLEATPLGDTPILENNPITTDSNQNHDVEAKTVDINSPETQEKPPKRRIAEICAFIIAIILIASTVAMFIQSSKKANAPSEYCNEIGITVQITNGLPPSLTNEQVISHLGTYGSFNWQEVDGYSFSCVDGRGTNQEIGTPGGDFSEFLLGLNMYFKLTNQTYSYDRVFDLFQTFITNDVDKNRPFYYHTDDLRLSWIFGNISYQYPQDGIPRYLDIADQQKWFYYLTLPQNQGCSHIRLTMTDPIEYETPLDLSQMLLKAFYDAMWNIDEFGFFLVVAVHGPQTAVAFTEIDVTGSCISKVPLATPTIAYGGKNTSMFIYNSQAVETFRRDILSQFLSNFDPNYPIDPNVLFQSMMDLSATQNAITVEHLAKTLPYYLVQVKTPNV